MANRIQGILEYIKEYGGKSYKAQDKCDSDSEKRLMQEWMKIARESHDNMRDISNEIAKMNGLEMRYLNQWQNSGKCYNYFWAQLVKQEYKNSPISISLFAEKISNNGNAVVQYRVSVELANKDSSELDYEQYRRLLDLELDDKLVFVKDGNDESDFRILDDRDNVKVKELGYRKVQVSRVIPEKECVDETAAIQVINTSVKSLMKYYDYVHRETVTTNTKKGNVKMERETESRTIINYETQLNCIENYILFKGFQFQNNYVKNFYLSLKSKPFVILAGTSGTGKTRLVKLFAEAIGAEYKLVPVRPDWSDSSDLFGHLDLNGKFIPGAIIDFVKAAHDYPDKPHIICLDEMNLARVEYYLSDFLSVIETRDRVGSRIGSDTLVDIDKYGDDKDAAEKYGRLIFPDNLYLVGTVNMDETTFSFSKKVLDRANTIEFNYVDLIPTFTEYNKLVESQTVSNDFLKTEYLLLAECDKDQEYVLEVCEVLQEINEILIDAGLHIGYRIRDEIVFYMLNNKKTGLLEEAEALDNAIMQKILPRIQGSSTDIKNCLDKLAEKFSDKYIKSSEKLNLMSKRFATDGFTSYWI